MILHDCAVFCVTSTYKLFKLLQGRWRLSSDVVISRNKLEDDIHAVVKQALSCVDYDGWAGRRSLCVCVIS